MKSLRLLLATCCMVLIGSLQTVVASEAGLDNPQVVEAFVDGVVMPLMKNYDSPNGAVAIVKDGELIFARGYGYQDIEKNIPVNPSETLFRPGSVSKLFTWVAVMQMVEQGKLDLDADVNTYLKTFKIKDTFPGQPVTMRHIMTHTTGFEDGAMGYLIIDDPNRIMPLNEAMKRYQPARVNPPGAQTAYSNYATSIAGLIVSNLSGLSFNDYIQQNIYDVLGMDHSSFAEPLPNNLKDKMAVGYVRQAGKYTAKPYEIISNFGPAGAMAGTVTDLVKFGQAILNGGEYGGGRILSEETVRQMLSRNFSHDDRMMGMALGFYETEENGIRLLGHGGDTTLFHSELVIDQEHNIVFFSSFGSNGGGRVRSAIKPAFYDEFFPVQDEQLATPKDFSERANKYSGNYVFWRSNFSKIEKLMKVAGGISVAPTANNTLLVSFGGQSGQYVEVEKNLFHELGGSGVIAFQENESGEITGFVKDGMPFMSTFKASFYETKGFNFFFIILSCLVFVAVFLRLGYQWSAWRNLEGAEKRAFRASILAAGSNLLSIVVFAVVMTAVGDSLISGIPLALKLWLLLPMLATLAGLYHLYNAIEVWKNKMCSGVWARIRYSIVTLCALFMCWFYYFWNLLGFQYLS